MKKSVRVRNERLSIEMIYNSQTFMVHYEHWSKMDKNSLY